MYFLAHYGNQLYVDSFRFFSTLEQLHLYIDNERLTKRNQINNGTPDTNHWMYSHTMQLTESVRTYVEGMPYRCYQGETDIDERVTTITRKQLADLLDPQE